ncbi:P-loop containing nucleoside triphosphate hydrolase protein [Panus rudis PR-1116 ss-1]|nr:P-loop containing nucleoside triphosphate hydrolase protein [Panus rudis PR-1116 ss-1]
MDPISFLEGVTAFIRAAQDENLTTSTQNTTSMNSPAQYAETGTGLSTIISMFLSFSALSDWLKLFVFGGLLETCRRLVLKLCKYIQNSFWITAEFNETDDSYEWIMHWLSLQTKWNAARTVDVRIKPPGSARRRGLTEVQETDSNKLRYIPSVSESYSLWYKGYYMVLTRERNDVGFHHFEEGLKLSIFSWDRSVLDKLMREAQKAYKESHEHYISVYAHMPNYGIGWRLMATRPKRPLNSIVLDIGITEMILDDARDFLESKSWYHERGIPFRRGYLLYGAPGSGKTSLIQSIAGELGLNVYIISLSRAGLDDADLSSLIAELPPRCIAIIEDIDAAMQRGINRSLDGETDDGENDSQEKQIDAAQSGEFASRVTLSGLLNALDGIGAQEGRILFATTNQYDALDPALCRPGRMDLHVEFKLASKYQARELFKRFYIPTGSTKSESELGTIVGSERGYTDEDDPAYGSEHSSFPPSPTSSTSSSSEKPLIKGSSHHSRPLRLSQRQLQALASRFADAIPERELSMATLQGYLMGYKTQPVEAVNEAAAWVEKERQSRLRRMKKRSEAFASEVTLS